MTKQTKQYVVKGALVLTLAAFISKLLSALYRIPLQNLTGDLGFYVYQQIYPFIGLIMILSLYSFPSAISKLSIFMLEKEEQQLSLSSFYVPVFLILLLVNGVLSFCLYFFSNQLGSFIEDPELIHVFRLLSFAFLLIPLISLLRGVFQARGDMKVTAYSQIVDQFIRVVIIIFTSIFIYYMNLPIYKIGSYGALATIIGLISASCLLIFIFLKKRPFQLTRHSIPWKVYIKTITVFGFIASLNYIILLMMQFVDVLTLVPALMDYGFSKEKAKSMKGIFDRGQPLIQFGTVIGSSFALALIPKTVAKKKNKSEMIDAFVISFYLSIAATVGLIMLLPEINVLFFKNNVALMSLRMLATSILFCSMTIIINTLLLSLGNTFKPTLYIGLTLCMKWALNVFLVPLWGLTGSSIATVSSLFVLYSLGLLQLNHHFNFRFSRAINWHRCLVSLISMGIFLALFKWMINFNLFSSRLSLLFYVSFLVISGAFIYLFLLIRLNTLSIKQIQVLPMSRLLLKFKR